MPSTEATTGFFNADFFSAMSRSARFVNIGRGTAVVEEDLVRALEQELIAGAMLDVFATEPLDQDDPMWSAPNLFVSPHISGDYCGFERDLVELFKMNLQRYLAGEQLYNLVDKKLGFVDSN
jgi:phosphoglycerate dehydrogenase-like enzyme